MFKRNKLSLQTRSINGMESVHEDFEKNDSPGIRKSPKPFQVLKKAVQHMAEDQEVRSTFKKAMVGIVVNVGFSLLVSGRYKLVKSVGVLVVGAIVLTVRKRKERKRLTKQEVDVLAAPVVS